MPSKELDDWWSSRQFILTDAAAIGEENLGTSEVVADPPVLTRRIHQRWTAAAIVALMLIAGAGGWLLRNSLERRGPNFTPVTKFSSRRRDSALSPDGQQMAFSRGTGPTMNQL